MKKLTIGALVCIVAYLVVDTTLHHAKLLTTDLNDDVPDIYYYYYQDDAWERDGASKVNVKLRDQLLSWHPYGSDVEALKERLIAGGAIYKGKPDGEYTTNCSYFKGRCEGGFISHMFLTNFDSFLIMVGEQNGNIVKIYPRYYRGL